MNTKPLYIICTIDNEDKQIMLSPAYPGSSIYHIFIDEVNHGRVQKITREWAVSLNEDSPLTEQHSYSILNAVENAETLNN